MSRETRIRRRELLMGIGGVGVFSTVGGSAGARTHALLADRSDLTSSFVVGDLDLSIDCAHCEESNGHVAFDFGGGPIEPGTGGKERLTVSVSGNPARVWLATVCPDPESPLASYIDVSVRVNNDRLFERNSLREFNRTFVDGVQIPDEGCVEPDDPIDIDVYWTFLSDVPQSLAGSSATLKLLFGAEQCRHIEDGAATNPFEGRSCDPVPEPECVSCVELGKADDLDKRMPIAVGDRLALDEGPGAGRYELEITDAIQKDGDETIGVRFDLVSLGNAPDRELCKVLLKGGPEESTYDKAEIGDPNLIWFAPETDDDNEGNANNGKNGQNDSGAGTENGPDADRSAISHIRVFVCAEADNTHDEVADDGCVPCENGESRVIQAQFAYDGPEDISLDVEQQVTGNGLQETRNYDARVGEDVTVDFNGSNKPDFVFHGTTNDGTIVTFEPAIHTSCSRPLSSELSDSDGTYTLTLVSATNKNNQSVCLDGTED
ncbi:hypothetical protein [Halalkalirubrum salinum]|uniref:hypothetical protein n=1 Tax=Halalkalirubrum salinum TaxID=2563889 RepID=UPI0010FB744F|nr:hypothetical protein [Halalkalirubrum salinum]